MSYLEYLPPRHKHIFHSLWWTFGPYGRQDVHIHDCHDEECARVIVGESRRCEGLEQKHWRETLGGTDE